MATTIVNTNFNGEFQIIITHKASNGNKTITPIVQDGVKWETDRQGSPSKLTFKVYVDRSGNLDFQEGDTVALRYRDNNSGWVIPFHGYIFTKKRTKDGWVKNWIYSCSLNMVLVSHSGYQMV